MDRDSSRVEPGIRLDFSEQMSYGDYLKLDTLFAAQSPLTGEHDETLFIVIHHVQELWLRQIVHELEFSMACIRADNLDTAFKALARVSRIQEQLASAWDVLSTMTPADYLTFRAHLGHASGFQSYQYRMVEFLLGAKDVRMLEPHRKHPAIYARMEQILRGPSLYDEAIAFLARRGFQLPAALLERDFSLTHSTCDALRDAWVEVYRASREHFEAYQLGEELVDIEDGLQQWRFRHMKTVHRIIGRKTGTGGSSGVRYLEGALERTVFPELWDARTLL